MTDTPNTPEASAAQNVQDTAARAAEAFGTLVETMALLRAPGGCPWDAERYVEELRMFPRLGSKIPAHMTSALSHWNL